MSVVVTLPGFISDLVKTENAERRGRLTVDAASMGELHRYFVTNHAPAAERLWDDQGRLRKNVILVHNDEPVYREDYDRLAFGNGDELCLLMQFAGG